MHYEDAETLDAAPAEPRVEIVDKTPEESNVLMQEEPEKNWGDVLEVDDNTTLENLKVPLSTQIRFRGSSSSASTHQSATLPAEALSSSPTSSRAAEVGDDEHVSKKLFQAVQSRSRRSIESRKTWKPVFEQFVLVTWSFTPWMNQK